MSHRQYVNLVSKESCSDHMSYKNIIWIFLDTSPAKVSRLSVENNCIRHTHNHVYLSCTMSNN